jgi:glycosyltransferase involved in cell wall biosynthesis
VSVVVPCRNEAATIRNCLLSLASSSYPRERLECLVVDGASTDSTAAIVADLCREHPWIRLLRNPRGITPVSLNLGIRNACGEIILRLDAHATYPPDYVSKCVYYLERFGADNVGGVIRTVPAGDTLIARTLARVLSHPFGIGNSSFRTGVREPREVDTVPFGCFRKSVFQRVGLFHEKLARSQDMEFNVRLKRAKGLIVLVPDIVSNYISRSTLRSFLKHSFQNGIWALYPLKFVRLPFSPRHYAPLIAVLALVGLGAASLFQPRVALGLASAVLLYVLASLCAALQISLRERSPSYLLSAPLAFAGLHLSYGLGSVVGLVRILMPERR